MDKWYELIEISDDEDEYMLIDYYLSKNSPEEDITIITDNTNNMNNNEKNYIEIVVKEEDDELSNDPKIKEFIDFCIKRRLFDDGFYDYSNLFSAIATKLPDTFDIMSKNGKDIRRERFIYLMRKKYKYKGDLNYIYNLMDKDEKGFITWEEFKDFFLPFIQNITL